MINLRYHIVSLTAVFLAIGIGLTLGSTFLDRATVDNLNGQLEGLETRLDDREKRISELEDETDRLAERDAALDEQANVLLTDRLSEVPVVLLAARGVEEADVQDTVQALVAASADVQGVWWLTERWRLDDDGEISDLAEVLEEKSADPSRLRRTAIDALGGELRARQLQRPETEDAEVPEDDGGAADDETPDDAAPGETTTTVAPNPDEGTPDEEISPTSAGARSADIDLLTQLVEIGFVEFEAVPGGPETARFPVGTRLLIAAGSPDVPDDLVIEPLLGRMGRATDTPVLAVLSSAMEGVGGVSDAVLVVRENESLRELISTVDAIEHFEGHAAAVLALAEVGDGVVGHYGLDESASRLLPAAETP